MASVESSWSVLRRDLQTLSADIAKLSEESLHEGQEKLAAEMARLKKAANEAVGRLSENSEASLEELSALVVKRPIACVAGAFGVGFILAVLASGRR